MIDTLRVLVSLKCNLACSYCCNEIPEVNARFKRVPVGAFKTTSLINYRTLCISGGEPLLAPSTVDWLVKSGVAFGNFTVLYTNGLLLTKRRIQHLEYLGLDAINVGLHDPKTYNQLIPRIIEDAKASSVRIRFQVEFNRYALATAVLDNCDPARNVATLKTWKMNECDTPNEEIILLT